MDTSFIIKVLVLHKCYILMLVLLIQDVQSDLHEKVYNTARKFSSIMINFVKLDKTDQPKMINNKQKKKTAGIFIE